MRFRVQAGQLHPSIPKQFLQHRLGANNGIQQRAGGVDDRHQPLGLVIGQAVSGIHGLQRQARHQVAGIALHDADFAHRIVNLFDGQIITEVKKQMGEILI